MSHTLSPGLSFVPMYVLCTCSHLFARQIYIDFEKSNSVFRSPDTPTGAGLIVYVDQVLNPSNSSAVSHSPPFAELDKLYKHILSFCPTDQIPLLKRISGYTVFPSSPRGIGHFSVSRQGRLS